MERATDAAMISVLCLMLALSSCVIEAAVAYVLIAVVMVCAMLLISNSGARAVAVLLFTVGCAIAPGMCAFTPLAAYACLCQRSMIVRAAWLIPLCVACAISEWRVSCTIAVLCAIACVLAVRTVRSEAERRGMRAVRDGLREQAIELIDSNRLLKEELEAGGVAGDIQRADAARNAECCASVFADLTDREQAVVGLIAEGLDNREIAGNLYLSEGTVRNHISAILQKKHLKNRTQIAIMYYRG